MAINSTGQPTLGTELSIEVIGGIATAVVIGFALWFFRSRLLRGFRRYFARWLRPFLLMKRLRSINLVDFIRDRSDYRDRFWKGAPRPNITAYLESADLELIIVSVTLVTAIQFEDLEDVLIKGLEAKKIRVTISLLDPSNLALVESVSRTLNCTSDELKSQIQTALERLKKLRKRVSPDARKRFTIRCHQTLPFASAIITDPDTENGSIQIETKPYRAGISDSMGFILAAGGSHPLYKTLLKSYRQLIMDGRAHR